MLTTFINTPMSAEADAVCGAAYGQSSPERTTVRAQRLTNQQKITRQPRNTTPGDLTEEAPR
ncbi:hypothetical protein ACVGOW_11765 [Pseudonocardia saturnea]